MSVCVDYTIVNSHCSVRLVQNTLYVSGHGHWVHNDRMVHTTILHICHLLKIKMIRILYMHSACL